MSELLDLFNDSYLLELLYTDLRKYQQKLSKENTRDSHFHLNSIDIRGILFVELIKCQSSIVLTFYVLRCLVTALFLFFTILQGRVL